LALYFLALPPLGVTVRVAEHVPTFLVVMAEPFTVHTFAEPEVTLMTTFEVLAMVMPAFLAIQAREIDLPCFTLHVATAATVAAGIVVVVVDVLVGATVVVVVVVDVVVGVGVHGVYPELDV
jgi:hypothetical protein